MAKELPYFQFEPAEYLTKDISFCTLSSQGLFINICSLYWQRGCVLTKSQVLRRFNYLNEFNELVDEKIIKLDELENITIAFLLNQYESIEVKKGNDSEKGKIGNLKRWHKPIYDRYIRKEITLNEALEIAKVSGGDSLAIAKTSHIKEDNIKEDNIKEDNIKNDFDFSKLKNTEWASEFCKKKGIQSKEKFNTIFDKFIDNIKLRGKHLDYKDPEKEVKNHFVNWYDKQPPQTTIATYKRNQVIK
jgi:hypothetical protein